MQAYSLSSDGPSEQRESVMKQDNEQLDLDNLPSVQYVVLDRQPSSVSHDFHFVFSDGIVRVQNSSGKINTSFRPQMTFSDFVTDYIHVSSVP
jgi:phage terminase large subunit-like protein